MTPYAEYLLARPKKPALTCKQAARTAKRSRPNPSADERNLSRQVRNACDAFFRDRELGVRSGSWGFRGTEDS
jgi:hypothetical protein